MRIGKTIYLYVSNSNHQQPTRHISNDGVHGTIIGSELTINFNKANLPFG
jgi:hypothetical protein